MVEKNEQFPNGVEAFFVALALFAVEYIVGAALYDMDGLLGLDGPELAALTVLIANACIFTALLHYKGLSYRQLFHSSPSSVAATAVVLVPAIVLTIPALVLAITGLMTVILQLFPLSSSEEAMFARMGSDSLGALIMGCVLAPVLEEMLFRGIVLRSFLQQYARWSAILGSAALFGFVHMNLYQFAVGVVMGVFLGWLYERTRSLVPCIALHASYNTALTVIAQSDPGDAGVADLSLFAYGAVFLLGAAGLVLLRRVLQPARSP